jgi:cytochrome c biogenesis protein ResB
MKKNMNISSVFKSLSSLKLTVVCLLILCMLVIWGTVYQGEHGLYQAQQKFFNSWVFFLFGFIPFPGTVLVMFVLFINLLFSIFYRIGFRLSKAGNIITHLGFLILLVGGFFTFYYSEESSITLREGESTMMSASRTKWEVAIKEAKQGEADVYVVDTHRFKPGEIVKLDDLSLRMSVKEYYLNCEAFTGNESPTDGGAVFNSSGIRLLKEKPTSPENEENIPGGVFDIAPTPTPAQDTNVLLYGDDNQPTSIEIGDKKFSLSLRKKKIPLPLQMTLLDFKMKMYPNSNIPKSYESKVTIKGEGSDSVEREVVISMNKPLRFKEYTFFQSSYFIDRGGAEYTVLAVVKNVGRLVPYFSSITIFLGLMIHFLGMLLKRRKKEAIDEH